MTHTPAFSITVQDSQGTEHFCFCGHKLMVIDLTSTPKLQQVIDEAGYVHLLAPYSCRVCGTVHHAWDDVPRLGECHALE